MTLKIAWCELVKKQAQRLLRSIGLYERCKSSWLYDWYWIVADRRLLVDRGVELEFYKRLLEGLRKGDIVFDVGANEGNKTDVFLRLGVTVIAIEPDNTNQEALRRRFLKLRLARKPVWVVGSAVSEDISVENMWIDAPGSAKNTLNQKWVNTLRTDSTRFGRHLNFASQREVNTTTLTDLISNYGRPFFVKIDVEGHELSVLRGMKTSVPYLSFEVNLPEFKVEGSECIQVLNRVNAFGEFNYVVDCRRGLALDRWVDHREFLDLFNRCTESSIEVFWRTPLRLRGERKI